MPLRLSLLGPARPGGGPDTERPELVEREHPVRELLHDLFDPVVPTNTPPQLAKGGHWHRTNWKIRHIRRLARDSAGPAAG